MKQRFFYFFFFLSVLGLGLPAQARWVIDRYEIIDNSEHKSFSKIYNEAVIPSAENSKAGRSYEQPGYGEGNGEPSQTGAGASLSYSGHNSTFEGTESAELKVTITPVFKWLDGGNPSDEIIYREWCYATTWRRHVSYDGGYANSIYDVLNPYQGQFLTVELKLPDPFKQTERVFDHYWGLHTFWSQEAGDVPTKIKATGTETRGPSRTFTGKITGSGVTLGIAAYGAPQLVDGLVGVRYRADITHFDFAVSAGGEFSRSLSKPRDKDIDAYASKTWMGVNNIGAPIRFFWGGGANYSANLSGDLLSVLNNPKYEWESGGAIRTSQDIYGDGTKPNADTELIGPSTPTKNFYHEADTYKGWEGPKTTTTKVKIIGNNPQKSELTAKAKINWYRDPTTRYRSESKFEIIDLDTGEITPFSPGSAGAGDEQDQLNEYIAEIEAAKTETFETGQALVSQALEGEMMAGSWFVPDETDLLIPVAGHVAGKVYKSVKKLRVLNAVLEKVKKIGGTALSIVKKERRLEGKSDNIVIRVTNDVENEGRLGKIPDGTSRADNAEDAAQAKKIVHIGQCFVAGTPVVMADGTTKAIDLIRAGDLVLSRDENTGDTQAKRVVQTFERQAPATLVLSFSSSERIETTKEHPFYVEGRGFVKAGELGIGTSIVIRAGPSLKVEKSEKKAQPATVYNFEVEDFHTYFVGQSGLWVHNSCNSDLIAAGHAYEKHLEDGSFASLGIVTRQEFSAHIDRVMTYGEVKDNLPGDRIAFFDEVSRTIVVYKKDDPMGGSCFRGNRDDFDFIN